MCDNIIIFWGDLLSEGEFQETVHWDDPEFSLAYIGKGPIVRENPTLAIKLNNRIVVYRCLELLYLGPSDNLQKSFKKVDKPGSYYDPATFHIICY